VAPLVAVGVDGAHPVTSASAMAAGGPSGVRPGAVPKLYPTDRLRGPMPSKESDAGAPTHPGDLVNLHFDLWAETGGKSELLDTTHETVAQEANAPALEGRKWGPRPHLIGGSFFPTGIENALTGVKVGETVEREFAPADAFGERDPDLIELFSMHEIQRLPEMRRDDAHLDLGTVLTINGRKGRVVTLTAARVRVDFNPPYAGRKVRGKFEVVDRISEPVEQIRAVLELQYGRSGEFHVETHEKTITIRIPDRSKFDLGWLAAKPRVIDQLRTQLKPHSVRIVEEYVTPTTEAKAPEAGKGKAPPASEPEAEPKSAPGPSEESSSAKHAPAKRAARTSSKDD
jgi:FKBP-type peptidyl-prolyl cis-trans isomerase 2